jgi:hypothetical protein
VFNPEFFKQVKNSVSQYNSHYSKSKKKETKKVSKQEFFSIKIPAYYYYQYEQNYQLMGFLNFKVTSYKEIKELPPSKSLPLLFTNL